MNESPLILFVCEHGAAKSIVAATYFNQLAKQRGLNLKAVARGTNPDRELSESAIRGLTKDGLIPTESIPQPLSAGDIQSAQQIVSFCDLAIESAGKVTPTVEQWDNIPPVGENYDKAREAIVEHLNDLINNIRSSS